MAKTLSPGDKAPDFRAQDQSGKSHSLADYKGKQLALFFYPQDDTPTCTKQVCNLRDNYAALKAAGYELLGVSVDDAASHLKFARKYDLPFPLLDDSAHKMVNDYAVWGEKQMFGNKYMGTLRTTFLIGGDGKILKIIRRVDSGKHAAQILG